MIRSTGNRPAVRSSSRTAAAALCAAAATVLACTERPRAPELDLTVTLPPVAAEYRTTISGRGESRRTVWHFWRQEDRVVTEDLEARTGEQWQRDGRTLFHRRFFHDDRRGIEFQADDLRMFDALPVWTQQALLVDPAILDQLSEVGSGWNRGHPYRRYAGAIGDSEWRITVLVDSMLPAVIERRENGIRQRTELVEAHALSDAPWRPTPTGDYRMLDFADLGDHERDPFVRQLHQQWGLEHAR